MPERKNPARKSPRKPTDIASEQEVLRALTRLLRREERETQAVTVRNKRSYPGETGKLITEEVTEVQLVETPTNLSLMSKAIELLGKHYALWSSGAEEPELPALQLAIDYGEEKDESGA